MATTSKNVIGVRSISLERAEGRHEECIKVTVPSWEEAEATMRRWGRTAPGPRGGYHKCDFIVTFDDGETYSGRFDLTNNGEDQSGNYSIHKHALDHLRFMAGVRRPGHMSEADYKRILDDYASVAPTMRKDATDALAKYFGE